MMAIKQGVLDLRVTAGLMVGFALLSLFIIATSLPYQLEMLRVPLNTVSIGLVVSFLLMGALHSSRSLPLLITTKFTPVHIVQAMVQSSVLFFLHLSSDMVEPRVPLILFQILFAINIDILCSVYFHRAVRLNLSALPIVMSFNLFLWFDVEYFPLQLVFIALGVLSKYVLNWERNGALTHVFNPSGIAMFFGTLVALNWKEVSAIEEISSAYSNSRPYIFLFVLTVGLISISLGRVALVTLGTVSTLFVMDQISLFAFGNPLMTKWISPSILVGATLLVTDPATTPKGPRGQFLYGAAYALLTIAGYGVLCAIHGDGYYSKILGLLFVNLMVRWFDRMDKAPPNVDWWAAKNIKFSALYAAIFLLIYPSMTETKNRLSILGRLGGTEWAEKNKR